MKKLAKTGIPLRKAIAYGMHETMYPSRGAKGTKKGGKGGKKGGRKSGY